MNYKADSSLQYGLGFHCVGCPYQVSGRCNGPTDVAIYNEVQKAFVGCADPKKILHYSDLYRNFVASGGSNQGRLKFDSRYVPQFFSRKRDEVLDLENRLVYVALERLIKTNGTINFGSKEALLRALGLNATTRIALVGTCRDITLERFWTQSTIGDAWARIADFGFEFVTGLSFSVYDEWPLFSQKFNQDRNFLSHDILSSMGVPSIPFLMPAADEDYTYVAKWLLNRCDVKTVAVHGTSLTRSERLFRGLIERMRRIREISPRPLRFLVVGVAKPSQMRRVLSDFDAIILNSRPVMEAMRAGNAYDETLTTFSAKDTRRDRLILPNIIAFERFCDSGGHFSNGEISLRP